MSHNALKIITDRARQLQKKHPNAKWVSLTKKAGAEYRAGKLNKKTATKKRVKRSVKKRVAKKSTVRTKKRVVHDASILKRRIINENEMSLIRATERLSKQTKKSAKNKIRKQIARYKATIKNVQAL